MIYALVAGDTGSTVVTTCKDSQTQAVIDLTGKAIQLRYKIDGGALQTKTMAIQNPPTAGRAEYQFGASDLSAGTLQGEIQIQSGAADQLTSLLPFSLQVRAPLS
jgi:hypothetical protein